MPNPTVRVAIDWQGEGTAGPTYVDAGEVARGLGLSPTTGSNDDVTADVRVTAPIVVKRGRDTARELSPVRAGTVELLLDNDAGLYSSRNAASPLYGYIKSGRLLDVDVTYGGTTYDIAAAYSNEPEEQPLLGQRSVRIYALDGLGRAGAAKVYTDMYTAIGIHTAIGYVLDAIGWPAGLRSLDTAATTLARWWVGGITGFEALKALMLTEGPGAMLYIDGRGYVVFESRHYRLVTVRSTTSQATFRDQGTEPLMSRFGVTAGEAGIVNRCAIPVRSYALAALGAIWTGPTPLTLLADETWTTTVSTTADGFDAAVNPTAAAGDFTVTAGAVSSATLNRDGGKTATLTIVAGAAGTILTGLRVRAQTVTISEQVVENTLDASVSIAAHGVQTLPDEFVPDWVPTVAEALDFCNAVVGRNQTERPQVMVGVNNLTDARLTQALGRRISDRVTAIDSSTIAAFSGDAVIEAVEYRFDARGDVFEATFVCEAALDVNYGFWDQGLWDVALWAY